MKRRGRRRSQLLGASTCLLVLVLYLRLGPLPDGLLDAERVEPSTIVLDRHGEVLYEARSSTGTRGARMAPDEIPPLVAAATVAAEDRMFRSHWGVDPLAIARAAVANLRAWHVVQGGSTLSQQVVSLLEAQHG
ncbi:MAG: transglycosylase domain-containing protein, partial [Acidobacteria bacterium]|nr:transglycosylase domain-containing protein [Acidobacteriota bacterium]